jgi:hypothetical protein
VELRHSAHSNILRLLKIYSSSIFIDANWAATVGEGTQNLLCACLAVAVFTGLAANTLLGAR